MRFTNKRVLEAIDLSEDSEFSRSWLGSSEILTVTDKMQLAKSYFGIINPEWILEDILSGNYSFFAAFDPGLTECPIEGWDIVGEDGEMLYQLWFQADSGVILKSGTTQEIARINRCELELFECEHLRKAISDARDEAKRLYPDTEIAGFPERYWLEEEDSQTRTE